MKPDLYTKAVLTVIAFMLVMIGCHHYVSPATTVKAEGPFAGVQFSGPDTFSFFDTKTGDLWAYDPAHDEWGGKDDLQIVRHSGKWKYLGKVSQLGQPLAFASK
jgi:hypothetical protein